ncbi:hypothetical protein YPPY16_4808, partial [Yersinia pestis PY-16]
MSNNNRIVTTVGSSAQIT